MEVDAAVWYLTPIEGWVAATVTSKTSNEDTNRQQNITVAIDETGDEVVLKIQDESQELENLKLRNDPRESLTDNLINVPHLHEPAIMYCLEQRYIQSEIYTYTGPILIAVNPFKKLSLYSSQILEMYYNSGLLKSQGVESTPCPPHVFAIADSAYRDMMSVILNTYTGTMSAKDIQNKLLFANQTILVSGESGAGKTESTKFVLRYLTTVGNTDGSGVMIGSVMEKILQSNPILEAFGNARTLRNDNSSRFGKFIELNFNKRGRLLGGSIRTYLLEKVRLPSQQPGERNYHIFYQLATGGNVDEKKRWALPSIRDLFYVNQGGIFQLRHMNDGDEFNEMKHALETLNFEASDRIALLNAMAGILHLGQVKFVGIGDGDGCDVSTDEDIQRSLSAVAFLWGVSKTELVKAMTLRMMIAAGEVYEIKMRPEQAHEKRDGLTKCLYGKLFDWIVATINLSINVEKTDVRANIGVLDIFGFESFKNNSFEQLCINYTNETLQQQFNQFIFKLEQVEYQKEGIQWSFIEFPDNQDCLDLIENSRTGIMAMLDDECKLPKASDEKFASRMYKSMISHARFSASVTQQRDFLFAIRHYAGVVVYNTTSFIEKNKDEVSRETSSLFQMSTVPIISTLFKAGSEATNISTNQKLGALSVATQFKEQLQTLMEKIHSTKPHYIRCLKPNDDNVPDDFNRKRTTEQLRYGGVLEAVRVARSGFPVRLVHSDFFGRYRCLANPFHQPTDDQSLHLSWSISSTTSKASNSNSRSIVPSNEQCQQLLNSILDKTNYDSYVSTNQTNTRKNLITIITNRTLKDISSWVSFGGEIKSESIQIGISKVFLRKTAHDILEARRSRRQKCAAILIQTSYRGFTCRKLVNTIKIAVLFIQRIFRGYLSRKVVFNLRQNIAAIKIQTSYRKYIQMCRYDAILLSTIILQCWCRRYIACQKVSILRYHKNCLNLQRICRGLTQRHKYRRFRSIVIALQCSHRRGVAKTELQNRQKAAKDLGVLQQSNDALKQEIALLRAKLVEDAKHARLEAMNKLHEQTALELQAELTRMKKELLQTQNTLLMERKLRTEAESKVFGLSKQMQELRLEVSKVIPTATSNSLESTSVPMSTVTGISSSISGSAVKERRGRHRQTKSAMPALDSFVDIISQSSPPKTSTYKMEIITPSSRLSSAKKAIRLQEPSHILILSSDDGSENGGRVTPEPSLVPQKNLFNTDDNIHLHQQPQLEHTVEYSNNSPSRRREAEEAEEDEEDMVINFQSSHDNYDTRNDNHTTTTTNTNLTGRSKVTFLTNNNDIDEEIKDSTHTRADSPLEEGKRVLSNIVRSVELSASEYLLLGNSRMTLRHQSSDIKGTLKRQSHITNYQSTLTTLKSSLKQGIKVRVWEDKMVVGKDILLRIEGLQDDQHLALQSTNKRGFSLFAPRPDLKNIRIKDILEIAPGIYLTPSLAQVREEFDTDDSSFLTILVGASSNPNVGFVRAIAILTTNREERNSLLRGLRNILADRLIWSGNVAATLNHDIDTSFVSLPTTSGPSSIVSSKQQNLNLPRTKIPRRAVGPHNQPQPTPAPSLYASIQQSSSSSSTNAVEEGYASGDADSSGQIGSESKETDSSSATAPKRKHIRNIPNAKNTPQNVAGAIMQLETEAALRQQLAVERSNYERVMVQMLDLTNDLNTHEDTIIALKKREAQLLERLTAMDKMSETDAQVRIQLGQRLQQVLMDKEDIKEQLASMKDHMEQLMRNIVSVKV